MLDQTRAWLTAQAKDRERPKPRSKPAATRRHAGR
jgi:hypothetical protein